jgi:hypothetical protein
VNLSGGGLTIYPGIYKQIAVSGNGQLTMEPGIYIIQGGGLSVSGNGTVTGSNVMIYNGLGGSGCSGAIDLSGNGAITLSAPTSGTYAGILIFQARNNSRALTFSGNGTFQLGGIVYAPDALLSESGNGQTNTNLIVDQLVISGNGTFAVGPGSDSNGTVYTPAQIRSAYGINNLSLDGTGQTIAIVDAYDDPNIYQSVDDFDSQFGLTTSGPSLYAQYGAASSFLTVLNQNGLATSLPTTDPTGAGNDNWEVEVALDVQWAHAIAPGAHIVLVEADSQALSDLMAGVATAGSQPGVSVVSMSWGYAEGKGAFAADEASYDSCFTSPGVTYVASTGDYGAAAPLYPAFSPNVLAVGGTTLSVNGDGSYGGETGWGYNSAALGAFVGSGGGISQYETEPGYQLGVQPTGMRTTPDVSFVADPNTGAWIADPYNLDPGNPWEIVGGTSLSAPSWGGLIALVNQGRSTAGLAALNSSNPQETQQSLYSLSQSDYHSITSGSNGYGAAAGYNLVTGLGTPVANLLVADLVAGNFPASGRVAPICAAGLVDSGSSGGNSGGPTTIQSVFTALPMPMAGTRPGAAFLSRQTGASGGITVGFGSAASSASSRFDVAASLALSSGRIGDTVDGPVARISESAAGTLAISRDSGTTLSSVDNRSLAGHGDEAVEDSDAVWLEMVRNDRSLSNDFPIARALLACRSPEVAPTMLKTTLPDVRSLDAHFACSAAPSASLAGVRSPDEAETKAILSERLVDTPAIQKDFSGRLGLAGVLAGFIGGLFFRGGSETPGRNRRQDSPLDSGTQRTFR